MKSSHTAASVKAKVAAYGLGSRRFNPLLSLRAKLSSNLSSRVEHPHLSAERSPNLSSCVEPSPHLSSCVEPRPNLSSCVEHPHLSSCAEPRPHLSSCVEPRPNLSSCVERSVVAGSSQRVATRTLDPAIRLCRTQDDRLKDSFARNDRWGRSSARNDRWEDSSTRNDRLKDSFAQDDKLGRSFAQDDKLKDSFAQDDRWGLGSTQDDRLEYGSAQDDRSLPGVPTTAPAIAAATAAATAATTAPTTAPTTASKAPVLPTKLSAELAAAEATESSRLFRLGFSAFILWFFLFPPSAIFVSHSLYMRFPFTAAVFVAAFALFALLARAKWLVHTHVVAALVSAALCMFSIIFLLVDEPQSRFILFCVLMVFAAYSLVVWGGALRRLNIKDATSLMMKGLVFVGVFRLCAYIPQLLFNSAFNLHFYYLVIMALVSLFSLVSGLYFMQSIPSPDKQNPLSGVKAGVKAGSSHIHTAEVKAGSSHIHKAGSSHIHTAGVTAGAKEGQPDDFYLNWRRSEFFFYTLILFAASLLACAFNGILYSPYMFSQPLLDFSQGFAELLLPIVVLIVTRQYRRNNLSFTSNLPFTSLAVLLLNSVLLATIIALSLTLFGQVGAFLSQALLGALGDTFFLLIILFAILPSSSKRVDFFSRLLVSVLCSGMFWAFSVGAVLQSALGYDANHIVIATVLAIVIIAVLLLVALSTAKAFVLGENQSEFGDVQAARVTTIPSAATLATSAAAPAAASATASAPASTLAPAAAASTAASAATSATAYPPNASLVDSREEYLVTARENFREACRVTLSPYKLTARELQVAQLVTEGLTFQAIAARLNIAFSTVRGYTRELYRKCNVDSRSALLELITGQGGSAEQAAKDSIEEPLSREGNAKQVTEGVEKSAQGAQNAQNAQNAQGAQSAQAAIDAREDARDA